MADVNIDWGRVNILEADIEEYLYQNPTSIRLYQGMFIKEWVARQFHVPSGVIDLLGVANNGCYVVVEVKNTEITSSALTQVSRYAQDIERIFSKIDKLHNHYNFAGKIVIGREPVTNQIIFEAEALGITLLTFDVSLSLNISSSWGWSKKYLNELDDTYENLKDDRAFFYVMKAVMEDAETDEEDTIQAAEEIIKRTKPNDGSDPDEE